MFSRQCTYCNDLEVRQTFESQHHRDLASLRDCAESILQPCPLCKLLWANIQDLCPEKHLQHFLKNWKSDPKLRGAKLVLISQQQAHPPDIHSTSSRDIWFNEAFVNVVIRGPNVDEDLAMSFIAHLNVSTTSESPGAKEIRGRNLEKSLEPRKRAETINLTKAWMNRCNNFDHRCCGNERRDLPSRVVDIGEKKPKLVETQGELDIYVALSYSWGDAGSRMFKFKTDTEAAFKKGIALSKLAKTHRQAIQVARELGYRYIWIDALCIRQDDNKDWADQALLVPEIYNNADLTIVAGASRDARDGFLDIGSSPVEAACQVPYQCAEGNEEASCWLNLPRERSVGPTTERAWCYQESLMARRMIIYGQQQLIFRCREREEFEDGASLNASDLPSVQEDHKPRNRIQVDSRPATYGSPSFGRGKRAFVITDTTDPVLRRWYSVTMEYSTKSFYDPSDNHAAFSGVVRLFKQALVNRFGHGSDRYMAGLWESDMICGLLWRSRRIVEDHLPALRVPEYKGKAIRKAPSWSWMALVGPISQGAGTKSDELAGFVRYGTPCCKPGNLKRNSWCQDPEGWEYNMVELKHFPDPYELQVYGYMRELRVSQYKTQDHPDHSVRCKLYPQDALNKHTFRLEASERRPLVKGCGDPNSNWSLIAATGLFDQQTSSNPREMWALRLTSEEGLLLRKLYPDKIIFERLGVFFIENPKAFYPDDLNLVTDRGRYHIPEDKLPVSRVIIH
ncbi:hypothetical protein FACUT_5077 [Fusarium acutatum]|uniref:Heterokaryon incompatibility domain-containing protein n=1 Tax=Fusarium acutatum TaxID=78861 RepID=A0A8H4NTY7_9HYPO|nr:hypothetical protein FACUT_5077 [Fusarium acutatum]